jgi:hypothetical protein
MLSTFSYYTNCFSNLIKLMKHMQLAITFIAMQLWAKSLNNTPNFSVNSIMRCFAMTSCFTLALILPKQTKIYHLLEA